MAKKKQLLTILLLCVLLAGLCGGYFFASTYQEKKEKAENADEEEIVLYSLKKEELTQIHYKNEKADLTLIKEEETWKLKDSKDFPVDQSKIEQMVESIASVTAKRTVTENCTDLSEYELDAPVLQVELTDKEGKQQKIAYGMESIAAEGCYAYTDSTKKVYVVSSDVTTEFDYAKNELMQLPEIADINTEYITSYAIEKRKGKGFKAVYDEKNAKYKNVYGWDITKPYSQTVAGDQDSLQTAFSGVTTIEFAEGVSYQATEKELKKYGLLSPAYTLSLKYYTVDSDGKTTEDTENAEDTDGKIAEEEKEYHGLKLLIGAMDDLQENYYVKLDNDPGIYLLSAETVESIVEIDPFSCVYTTPCPVNTEELEYISLQYAGKKYKMSLVKEEKADSKEDSTDVEYNYTAKINGKKVDDAKFRKAYEAFGEIVYSSTIKETVKPKSNTPVATIAFTEKDRKSTITFLPYDGTNFYRVNVDGVCQFVADKNTIDTTLKNLVAVD